MWLNLLANLGTMWFDPSLDFLQVVFRSSIIIVSCGLAPHGILLMDNLHFSAVTFSFFLAVYWRILAQCGLAHHRILTVGFHPLTIIVSCGLAPHGILLTDSLHSLAVTFSFSRRRRFDPTIDFDYF